jgi:hypothetical protein
MRDTGPIQVYDTYEEAVESAKSQLDKRSYNHKVIYQAMAVVQRTAPPIEVINLETGDIS